MLLVSAVTAPAMPTQEPLQAPTVAPVADVEPASNVFGAHGAHTMSALDVAACVVMSDFHSAGSIRSLSRLSEVT